MKLDEIGLQQRVTNANNGFEAFDVHSWDEGDKKRVDAG